MIASSRVFFEQADGVRAGPFQYVLLCAAPSALNPLVASFLNPYQIGNWSVITVTCGERSAAALRKTFLPHDCGPPGRRSQWLMIIRSVRLRR
jgi:hypothetical protein